MVFSPFSPVVFLGSWEPKALELALRVWQAPLCTTLVVQPMRWALHLGRVRGRGEPENGLVFFGCWALKWRDQIA